MTDHTGASGEFSWKLSGTPKSTFQLPSSVMLPIILRVVLEGSPPNTASRNCTAILQRAVLVALVALVVVVVARVVLVPLLVVVGTDVEDKEELSVDAEDEVDALVLTEVDVPELVLMDVVEDETVVGDEIASRHSEA